MGLFILRGGRKDFGGELGVWYRVECKRREQAADSIRVRYVNSNLWIVYLDLLLIAKFYLRKC
jgi:hypothetical protein